MKNEGVGWSTSCRAEVVVFDHDLLLGRRGQEGCIEGGVVLVRVLVQYHALHNMPQNCMVRAFACIILHHTSMRCDNS